MIVQQQVEEVKGEQEIKEKSLENWSTEIILANKTLALQKEQLQVQQQMAEQRKLQQELEQKHIAAEHHKEHFTRLAKPHKGGSLFDAVALLIAQNTNKFQQLKPILDTTNELKDEELKEWVQSNLLTETVKTKAGALEPMASVALFTAKLKQRVKEKKLFDEKVLDFFKTHDVDEWEFDVFALAKEFKNPLVTIATYVVQKWDFFTLYNIAEASFKNFITECESTMTRTSYHNAIHVTDVVQTMHVILRHFKDNLNMIDIFSGLLAAMIHDLGHPGHNNLFEINTESERALTYNNQAVLENYHLFTGLQIIKETKLLDGFTKDQQKYIKNNIISMVLATDISKHIANISNYNTIIQNAKEKGFNKNSVQEMQALLGIAVKTADISNPAKPREMSILWTDRVLEEFYAQGDKERSLGLPISPLCDRNKEGNRPSSQIGFIDFICRPMFNQLIAVDPKLQFTMDYMNDNYNYWKQVQAEAAAAKQ